MQHGSQLVLQYDWRYLTMRDIIEKPDVFPVQFKIPNDFNKTAICLRNQIRQTLQRCDNLVELGKLVILCAKMQHMHNRFCANGHNCEAVYDNDTANTIIRSLYNIASSDLKDQPIKYVDLHLFQGPVLINGECGHADIEPNGALTYYVVNDNTRTIPVFNGDVKDAQVVESVKVLFYIMNQSLRALYNANPQGHVDGFIFQNICCNSFDYPEMKRIFDERKAEAKKRNLFDTANGYPSNIMDWGLSGINNHLDISVRLLARTGVR